jgi:hypothetical protein
MCFECVQERGLDNPQGEIDMNIEDLKKQEEALSLAADLFKGSAYLPKALSKDLADVREQIAKLEESKVKTKYAIGQDIYYIKGGGEISGHIYDGDPLDRDYIAMGNDAETHEEAERIIRRRKAVVKYNEIAERENACWSFDEYSDKYYLTRVTATTVGFFMSSYLICTDVKPVIASVREKVIDQLTPELINDLFCN